MKALRRRLGKLEASLLDESRLRPESQAWKNYWGREIDRYYAGEREGSLALDAVCWYVRNCPPDPCAPEAQGWWRA
jgi:hypothetical protein